jgi:class 3 adenylate cyclase
METEKNIDRLALRHSEKSSELLAIKNHILNSSAPAAIVFVDLADSASLKHKKEEDAWLSSIYEFIRVTSDLVRNANGTLVKRLGDGMLITFQTVAAAELFIDAANIDVKLHKHAFKIAADFGNVYYFRFEDHLKDDPYGVVVDRCARILDLACPGLPLFGEGFVESSSKKSEFHFAVTFRPKGFPMPEKVFIKAPAPFAGAQAYLAPLIATLNNDNTDRHGYRYAAKIFSESDFSRLSGEARPFLLRELFNVPKLPFSFPQFNERVKAVSNEEELYDFYGMLVEWECVFGSYARIGNDHIIVFAEGEEHCMLNIHLKLPALMFDVVRLFKKDSRINCRGIIQVLNSSWVDLNYVDFDLSSAH